MQKTIWFLACFIFIANCFLIGCASTNKLDKYGNPIVNSINVLDTTIGEWGVSVGYYPVASNINNKGSYYFVSESPTADQIFDYILNKPAYFFIIHKNRVISKMAIFISDTVGNKRSWKYRVVDNHNDTSLVNSDIHGSIFEHRYMELTKKLGDPNYAFLKEDEGLGIPSPKRVFYMVIPFKKVLSDLNKKIIQNE
jgi:hypothetical protein